MPQSLRPEEKATKGGPGGRLSLNKLLEHLKNIKHTIEYISATKGMNI